MSAAEISVLMDVVAGMSSAIATFIALYAILLTRGQMREVHRFWRVERRSEVYRAVVREPVVKCRDVFLEKVRTSWHDCREDVKKAMEGGCRDKAEQAVGQLFAVFNRSYHRYRDELAEFRNIQSLDLGEFADELVQCTTEFQDEFTRLADGSVDATRAPTVDSDVAAALAKHSARVADLVARYDPCLRSAELFEDTGSVGWWGKLCSRIGGRESS